MDREYVLKKLAKKQKLDPNYLSFGVERHQYQLNPPIEALRLEKLEKKFKISLPKDFRKFLLTIGDGGAGPGYGLYSLEGALTGKDPNYNGNGRKLGEITKDFIRPDELVSEYDSDLQGLLILCQHGCANDDFLVINGKERGFVWECITNLVGGLVPLLKQMPSLDYINQLPENQKEQAEEQWVKNLFNARPSEQMTFTDWYKNWLEKPPVISPWAKKRARKKIFWGKIRRLINI